MRSKLNVYIINESETYPFHYDISKCLLIQTLFLCAQREQRMLMPVFEEKKNT
jgi:hypothetical protein